MSKAKDELPGKIDDYFALRKEIFDYFGYVEDWRVIPIEDSRDVYWHLTGEGHGDEVYFCYDKGNAEKLAAAGFDYNAESVDGNDVYSSEIYTQRHLPRWVYRRENYTMICVDTLTDGNKFLQIFDNSKEMRDV